MASVNFSKITSRILDNIRTRTMKSASWRKPLLNVMDRVVTPIAMSQVKVADNLIIGAMLLQGEINQKLFELPEKRPVPMPVSGFNTAEDVFSSPSMIAVMSDVGKKAANGKLNVSGEAPAGEVTSILTFHKDEKVRFAGKLLCGENDAELTTYSDKGIYALTYLGKRKKNQDALATHVASDGTLHLMVADGMGGETHGEIASEEAAINFLKYLIENKSTRQLIQDLDGALKSLGERSPHLRGMGTTMAMVEIKDGEAIVRHVGDSLVLLVKANGEISLLTFPNWQHFSDYTLLKKAPPYNEAESARIFQNQSNVLGYAVGHSIPPSVPEIKVKLFNGDRILLATDGLFTSLPLAEIKRIVTEKRPLNEIGQELKLKAAENQAKKPFQEGDNISLQIYEHTVIPGRISTDELLRGIDTNSRTPVSTGLHTLQLIAEAEAAIAGRPANQPATTATPTQQLIAEAEALTSESKPTPPSLPPLPIPTQTEIKEVTSDSDLAQVEKMIEVLSGLANFMRQREYLTSEIKDIQQQSMKAIGILENTLRQIEGVGARLDTLKFITKK